MVAESSTDMNTLRDVPKTALSIILLLSRLKAGDYAGTTYNGIAIGLGLRSRSAVYSAVAVAKACQLVRTARSHHFKPARTVVVLTGKAIHLLTKAGL